MAKRVQTIIKANIYLILSLALLFTWIFEIRFTGLLYLNSVRVLHSSFFSLATASTVLLGLLLVRPSVYRLWTSRRTITIIGTGLTVCAVLTTLVPYIAISTVAGPSDLLYLIDGILFGIVSLGLLMLGISIYKHHELITSWCLLISSSLIALILLVISNWFIRWNLGYLYTLLPCFSFGIYLYDLKRNEKKALDENPPRLSELPAKPRLLHLLLFFTGFFVVFMPTLFPKTTNLTINYFSTFNLGGLNYVSLVALILYNAFLIFLFLFVGGKMIGTPIVSFLVSVVFAFAFYFLSSMSTSNLSFMIIMPCSMVFALCACAIFLATVDLRQAEGMRQLRVGLIWLSLGGLLAAVFSTVFLGPLYGVASFQDVLFVVLTASIFIIIVALFVSIYPGVAALFIPNNLFKEKLDSSSIENRCRLIGTQYKLTGREVEVLLLLAEGRNEPYIAEALTVSRATAKTHIKHIYQKIDISSRQELLDYLHRK